MSEHRNRRKTSFRDQLRLSESERADAVRLGWCIALFLPPVLLVMYGMSGVEKRHDPIAQGVCVAVGVGGLWMGLWEARRLTRFLVMVLYGLVGFFMVSPLLIFIPRVFLWARSL